MPAPTPPPDRLLSVPEVCKRLGCSKHMVYGLIGVRDLPAELPHIRVGTNYKVFEHDLEAWIAGQTQNAGLRADLAANVPVGHMSGGPVRAAADGELATLVATAVVRALAAAGRG